MGAQLPVHQPHMFWWEIVEIAKKVRHAHMDLPRILTFQQHPFCNAPWQLFLVGFCVLILPGSTMQLIFGFGFSLVLLLMTAITEPYTSRSNDYFALLCNFCLVALMFFSLVLKVGLLSEEVEGILSSELKALYTYNTAQLSVALVCTLLASIIVAVFLAVCQMYRAAQTAARMAAAEREAAEPGRPPPSRRDGRQPKGPRPPPPVARPNRSPARLPADFADAHRRAARLAAAGGRDAARARAPRGLPARAGAGNAARDRRRDGKERRPPEPASVRQRAAGSPAWSGRRVRAIPRDARGRAVRAAAPHQ